MDAFVFFFMQLVLNTLQALCEGFFGALSLCLIAAAIVFGVVGFSVARMLAV